MRKIIPFGFAVLSSLTVVYGQAKNIEADRRLSSITYHVYHIFHSVDGVSSEIFCSGQLDSISHKLKLINVSANVLSFNSGNSSRDKTAMNAVDAEHYSQVVFQSDTINYVSDSTLFVVGKLSFHGITNEISMPVSLNYESGTTDCEGGFEANFSDYNVERPSIFFISIGNKFGIKFHIVFDSTF
ncbi:MAG TPA: YceI family protein [Candidatus Acidoferrales bacterium]|nr:YceI family protein [Candidatus Acidoferrales bacterium]